MTARVAVLIYGIASYLVFFCSLLNAVAFIGNYVLSKSIDVGSESGFTQSVLTDVVLLGLFAVQHSVMARPTFKRWWTTIVPASGRAQHLCANLEPSSDPNLLAVAADRYDRMAR